MNTTTLVAAPGTAPAVAEQRTCPNTRKPCTGNACGCNHSRRLDPEDVGKAIDDLLADGKMRMGELNFI